MQKCDLMALSIAVTLYVGQAIAAEQAVTQDSSRSAVSIQKKMGKSKQRCVQEDGKPCRSSKSATSAKPEAKKVEVLTEAEGRKLAQQSGCFMCHSIEKKVVGPAWKDVAAKYRGDAGAEARLVTKVTWGGSGVWGRAPMPANSPAVSEANIKSLVKFVLSLQ